MAVSAPPPKLNTASGAAPSFSARAWVCFNGYGTVAIRASGNVSSITDNGTGDYTVNFTTAMPDANFSAVAMTGSSSSVNNYAVAERSDVRTASMVRMHVWNGATLYDLVHNSIAIFR